MNAIRTTLLACAAVVLLPAVAPAQEVFKEVSAQRLEGILGNMGIQYKKFDAGNGVTYYDFTSKNLILRLTNFNGKDLMIDIYLPAIDTKAVNDWNMKAKFSRVYLRKDAKGKDSVVLASNLDVTGGVTEDTIKHFIRGFDKEIAAFGTASTPAVGQDEVFKGIPTARLEKILDGMKITYKKGSMGKDVWYDFTKNVGGKDYFVRLTNFDEQDLMIDAWFPTSTVAKVNYWNVKRSYVRAVLYPASGNTQAHTALEANLDCVGGTADSIIRYFITTFDQEVRDFDNYLSSNK
jgi:hypothetical protein